MLLLVAALVRFTSPGPVFFSHRRISLNGAFFSMWKFRTMSVDSTERLELYLSRHPEARVEWNKHHKLRNDPRVTSIGLFLRRYSLDELPQVWKRHHGAHEPGRAAPHCGRGGGKVRRPVRLLLPRQARRHRLVAGFQAAARSPTRTASSSTANTFSAGRFPAMQKSCCAPRSPSLTRTEPTEFAARQKQAPARGHRASLVRHLGRWRALRRTHRLALSRCRDLYARHRPERLSSQPERPHAAHLVSAENPPSRPRITAI